MHFIENLSLILESKFTNRKQLYASVFGECRSTLWRLYQSVKTTRTRQTALTYIKITVTIYIIWHVLLTFGQEFSYSAVLCKMCTFEKNHVFKAQCINLYYNLLSPTPLLPLPPKTHTHTFEIIPEQ